MTPLERYRDEIGRGVLDPDPSQEALAREMQRVYDALVAPSREDGLALGLRRLLGGIRREPVLGIYAWGGVGRGKTHLMNALHESLPFDEKLRIHFHSFMQYVHDELKALGHREDPLPIIAASLADDVRVLCFDEFHVSDIADAMLLGRLLAALFERGVTLVATSNTAPDDLYRDGLQRERFLPAIALIEQHTRVTHLDGDVDYRLRALERAEIYHHPLDERARESLERGFEALAPEGRVDGGEIVIAGRSIPTVARAEGIAWFGFDALCDGPRSASDYVEIARRFHTVLVSDVPRLDDEARDRTLRFVHLIDALYDRNVNLLATAAEPPATLYEGARLAGPFARTRSRLEEMRSREYLGRGHLP